MALINSTAIPSGATGYEIEQSLRLDNGNTGYLSRTPASAGNRRTWTFSTWVKRGELGVERGIFGVGTNSSEPNVGFSLYFFTDDCIRVWTNGANASIRTTAKYRDTSAWYHVVLKASTSSPYFNLYVNGAEITDFTLDDRATYPGTNDTEVNQANTAHYVGGWKNGPYTSLRAYLAETHFIDGTALNPTSFGETGDYGEWKPIEVEGLTYGTNGFYLNFAGGGVLSATGGNSTATDGDYKAASFTSSGTFTPSVDGYVEYLVIAGGGGGGSNSGSDEGGGGGGAGGYRTGYLSVTASTAYSITVGGAGLGRANGAGAGGDGSNSVFSTITSIGGGGGGATDSDTARSGGSGGGMGSLNSYTAGAGTAGQGNAGGTGHGWHGGGGGGAGQVGGDYNPPLSTNGDGGNGGNGLASSITGSSVTRAGGGGAGTWNSASYTGQSPGTGGSGGGGAGGATNQGAGSAGTVNTGGGGGGAGNNQASGAGGTGIVIIRYKFQ